MLHLRTLVTPASVFLLLALVSSGCLGSGGDEGQAAAAQLLASDFQVASPSFTEIRPKKRIPKKNSCYGENLSPPLSWSGTPAGTESYALIAEDVDHHTGIWVHWVLYNIPADVIELAEGIPTSTAVLPDGTTQGINDDKQPGYNGVCPPEAAILHTDYAKTVDPPHKYFFRLYALDSGLSLAPGATKGELLSAMDGHILAQAETVGKHASPILREHQRDLGTPTPAPSP